MSTARTISNRTRVDERLYRLSSPAWAREHCRISPPRFLAECCMRRINQGSFVLLCFALFAFSGLCLVLVITVFDLSFVRYFPT